MGHLYHGYVSHNQMVPGGNCATATQPCPPRSSATQTARRAAAAHCRGRRAERRGSPCRSGIGIGGIRYIWQNQQIWVISKNIIWYIYIYHEDYLYILYHMGRCVNTACIYIYIYIHVTYINKCWEIWACCSCIYNIYIIYIIIFRHMRVCNITWPSKNMVVILCLMDTDTVHNWWPFVMISFLNKVYPRKATKCLKVKQTLMVKSYPCISI